MKKRKPFLMVLFASAALSLIPIVSFIFISISGAVPAYAGQNASGAGVAANRPPQTVKRFYVDPEDMRVSFDFQNASVVDVIRMIAKVSDMNVLIGSDVKGTVTMKMKGVPLKNILSLILEAYGLGMVKKDGIYYINSTGTIASVVSAAKKERAISEHKITRLVPVNYVSASGLMAKVKSVLSSQGRVIYDKSLHSLLITDIPNHVARAVKLVKMLDKRTPEVEIAAKMVEVDKTYVNQLGINWNGNVTIPPVASVASYGAPSFVKPSSLFTGPSFNGQAASSAGTFTLGILNHNGVDFSATLQALESLTKAKSIASPKVVVLNNEAATIGKTVSLSYILPATGVGGSSTIQTVTLPITLQITPHIMANGNVKLVINFSNTTPVAPPSVGIGVTPTTSTDQETINSTVIVNNGQTVVVGGVYQMNRTVTNSGIPGLMSIPLLGWLFKSQNINNTKEELLIFITPRIIKS